eukprot:6193074-Pleurochrysis_carterae.AAC.7
MPTNLEHNGLSSKKCFTKKCFNTTLAKHGDNIGIRYDRNLVLLRHINATSCQLSPRARNNAA